MSILKRIGNVLLWLILAVVLAGQVVNEVAVHLKKDVPRRYCQENLDAIGRGCLFYASQHGGRFPSSLADIASTNAPFPLDAPWTYVCLSNPVGDLTNVNKWSDYTLVAGLSTASPRDTVLVFEPISDHFSGNVGGNVLYVTGKSKWLKPKEHAEATKGLHQQAVRGDSATRAADGAVFGSADP